MGKTGILVISHGSQNGKWVAQVEAAVAAMSVPEGIPVYASYLELVEGRLIQDGIDALEGQGVMDIIAVPFFISSGSTHLDEIEYALGLKPAPVLPTDLGPFRIRAGVRLCRPIDDEPEVAAVLVEKLAGISRLPQRETVLLIGHGSAHPGFHDKWREGLEKLAARVRLLGGFADAGWAMLRTDRPAAIAADWKRRYPDRAILASPVFISAGYFTDTVIPRELAGTDVRYAGRALLPHPYMTAWLERRVREAIKGNIDLNFG